VAHASKLKEIEVKQLNSLLNAFNEHQRSKPKEQLDTGSIPFQAEGRLLQELGLRLVAKPEVALVELIKNAYDADSAMCVVRLEGGGKTLVVADEGHA